MKQKDFEELLNEQFELLNFQFLAENKKFNMNEFSDKTIENIAKILVQIMNGNTLDNKLNSKFQKYFSFVIIIYMFYNIIEANSGRNILKMIKMNFQKLLLRFCMRENVG